MDDIYFWIAIISAIAAIVTAWYTAHATRISKKNLEVALQQIQLQDPNLELYLVDGHIRRFINLQYRIYAFHLRISNKADANNSLRELSLTIIHNRGSEISSNFTVPHDSDLNNEMQNLEIPPLQIPSKIGPHETLAGYALFRVNDNLLRDSTVEAYKLKVIDGHGIDTVLEPILLREYSDEEKTKTNQY